MLACWRGLHFFSGTVLKVHTETSDGEVLLDIEYLDGEVERSVPRCAVVPELGDDKQTDEDHKEEQELCDMARCHGKAVSMSFAEYEREEKENLAKFSALQAQYERNSLQLKNLEEDANRKRMQLLRSPFQQAPPAQLYASILSQNTPNAS